jgi:hypothetical protein
MNCRTNCCKTVLVVFVLLAMAIVATSAFAANPVNNVCLQNEYNFVQKQKLNCTANDVSIAQVTNIRGLDGKPLNSCIGGSTFDFIADFTIKTTSSQARENIGLYIATNSTTQALTGSCDNNIITPQHQCPNGATGVLCGSTDYHETDAAPDNCGDTSSNDGGGTGIEIVTLEVDGFSCTAPAGSTQLVLPNCTSWQIPGGTIQCVSNDGSYPLNGPGGTPTAIPGSPAKCNCGVIPLAITVQQPNVTVDKSCTTSTTSGLNHTCDLQPEGGDVTYTVTVTNASNFGSVVIDQICDDQYGNIFTVSGFSGAACPAGNTGSINSTTCSALTVGSTPQFCTFTVTQAESKTVKDIVTVAGHGQSAGLFSNVQSNQVTVTSHEAATSGTIVKSFVANEAACATVRYQVAVTNTSASGTDESFSLNSVTDDKFGDITSVHGTGNNAVLGTTCGVANGQGTLSGTSGAGLLPQTLSVNGGAYTCQFDGQFCSGLVNGCFSHTNTVSATVTGDEGAADVVSLTPGGLTVNECLTAQ